MDGWMAFDCTLPKDSTISYHIISESEISSSFTFTFTLERSIAIAFPDAAGGNENLYSPTELLPLLIWSR